MQAKRASHSIFRSCLELQEQCLAIGFNVDIAQITSGPLYGQINVNSLSGTALVHIETNQGLLVYGNPPTGTINVAIEHSKQLDLHRVQGSVLTQTSLSGFNARKTQTYFSVTPGSRLSVAIFPANIMLSTMHQLHGEQGTDILLNQNLKRISPKQFDHILSSTRQRVTGTFKTSDTAMHQHDYILSILNALGSSHSTASNERKTNNIPLVEQFVRTCFEEGCTNPLTINDLTTKLFSSKTVLSQSIKESTGLSPMTFLRNVRLEQVRSQLIRGDSSTSIISVAQKYGFPSRGHFSRYYRELFGELPSETAARSKYF